jgi:hypothetical protein
MIKNLALSLLQMDISDELELKESNNKTLINQQLNDYLNTLPFY